MPASALPPTANMATFPARLPGLRDQIPALLAAFPSINICVNEVDEVPAFLRGEPRITAAAAPQNLMAVGKTLFRHEAGRIVFTIDDDIRYPANYVAFMSAALRDIGAPAALCVHARDVFVDADGVERRRYYNFLYGCPSFRQVAVAGTGTVCTWAELLPDPATLDDFRSRLDLGFARHCQHGGIPQIVVPRPAGWLRATGNQTSSLFTRFNSTARFGTDNDLFRSIGLDKPEIDIDLAALGERHRHRWIDRARGPLVSAIGRTRNRAARLAVRMRTGRS